MARLFLGVRTYVRTCTRTHVRTCVHVHVRTYVRACMYTYARTYVCMCIRIHIRTCEHVDVHTTLLTLPLSNSVAERQGCTNRITAHANLYASLREAGPLGEVLSRIDVGVVGSFESLLELIELVRRERRSISTLLPVQFETRFRSLLVAVRQTVHCSTEKKL